MFSTKWKRNFFYTWFWVVICHFEKKKDTDDFHTKIAKMHYEKTSSWIKIVEFDYSRIKSFSLFYWNRKESLADVVKFETSFTSSRKYKNISRIRNRDFDAFSLSVRESWSKTRFRKSLFVVNERSHVSLANKRRKWLTQYSGRH